MFCLFSIFLRELKRLLPLSTHDNLWLFLFSVFKGSGKYSVQRHNAEGLYKRSWEQSTSSWIGLYWGTFWAYASPWSSIMVHHLRLIIYDAKLLSIESHIVLHKHIQVVTKSLFMVCVYVDGCMGFSETLFHGLLSIYETNPTYCVNCSQWSHLLKFHFTEELWQV